MNARGAPVEPVRQPVPTTHGPAGVRVFPADPSLPPRGSILVGHGAGGQQDAADVLALAGLGRDGWTVVLVDQPWRVAGRKVATPPPTLDRGWLDILAQLSADDRAPDGAPVPRPWVYAGRSAGARVACRTSVAGGGSDEGRDGPGAPGPAAAVVALAFPLHPPGKPERSRAAELAKPVGAGVPTLVVQGRSDPMGTPAQILEALGDPVPEALTLCEVTGNHSPTREVGALLEHVRSFLDRAAPTPGRC